MTNDRHVALDQTDHAVRAPAAPVVARRASRSGMLMTDAIRHAHSAKFRLSRTARPQYSQRPFVYLA